MERHSRSECIVNIPAIDVEKVERSIETGNVTIKRGSISIIKDYLIDYTANSNLHGLRYIGEKKRTKVEKLFWLSMFTCCVALCAIQIFKVWIKWNESPVIVTFAESPTPVWQIPFPAVTICSETKVKKKELNFTEKYYKYQYWYSKNNDNFTYEPNYLFEDVSLVCDVPFPAYYGGETSSGNETVENIKQASPNRDDTFFWCQLKDIEMNCGALFNSILTEEGICYTFNMMSADKLFRLENLHKDYQYFVQLSRPHTWSPENGYPPDTPLETYPRRGTGYGVKTALKALLQLKKTDFDYLCKGPVQGFRVLLHNPAEFPRLSQQYFRLPQSQEVIVAIKPKMITTSEGLKPYDAITRQCYFPSERHLEYFRWYTQANCEMECLTNFTHARCGCVHFGMPHGPKMAVCDAGGLECIRNAQREFLTIEFLSVEKQTSDANDTLNEALLVAAECKCLPSCTSIEYEAETSQADFDWESLLRAVRIPIEAYEDMLFPSVAIFFKEPQFIASRRSELYGPTDFLANCGGLLGLFMGFSILSVVEILYFLTLRLCCVFWTRRQAKKN